MEEPAATATATAQNPREVSINRARSRSRGRSNPSELLARRQQLLGSESNGVSGWNGSSPLADSSSGGGGGGGGEKQRLARASERRQPVTGNVPEDHHHHHQSDGRGKVRMQSSKSVEARLESLSELLKSHQMNEPGDVELQFSASSRSIDDVYILLAKKEEDLQLAAELGKVLLEKNDELSKANERITEEYSHKLELLEQDKHKLKRQLDLVNGEYENRLIELQADCNILKNQLEEQQQVAKQREKEKSKLIDDLAQQNQRLTSELVEATKSEELLSSQLEQMNERFNVRMSNRQDHVVQLDALKEEIQIVNQRKQDLERRLKLANNDKGNLNAALDESGDKLMLLENLLNERDLKLSEMLEEINELRDSSSWLSNELEAMISLNERLAGSNATSGGYNEQQQQISAASSEPLNSLGQRKRSQLVEQLRELRLKQRSRLKASELMLIRRRSEARANSARTRPRSARRALNTKTGKKTNALGTSSSLFDEMESSADNDDSSSPNRSPSSRHYEDEDDDDDDDEADYDEQQREGFFPLSGDWKDETLGEIFALLVRFQQALQQRKDSLTSVAAAAAAASASVNQTSLAPTHLYSPNSTTEDSGISADDIDKTSGEQQQQQASDPALWQRLISSLKALIEEMPCSTCQLMIGERADYERLQKLHSRLCDEVRKKDDELLKLQMSNTEQETKLAALEDRCAILSDDLSNCDRPKEEIVQLAWKARDEAVERKNNAEIALAKTRIENMQISSQLMEVVQQKGELSQRLAQFEDDIHHITQHSVKAKFTWEEYTEKLRHSKTAQPDSTGNSHTYYHSNPLAQLLNFSVASTRDTNGSTATTTTTTTSNTASKSSAMDHLSQPVSLMRNLTSNRFNLRFWQRSSAEKSTTADKGSGATTVGAIDNNNSLGSSNNNNSNNISLAEQHTTATGLSAV